MNTKSKIKLAYIGGGSRGWAWSFMSDLAAQNDLYGDIYLYDIDHQAALYNEKIGNNIEESKDKWTYHASQNIGEALGDADFVIISILPGTFEEMESDVHLPEEYGIYQSVGDTTGPGGVIRALRTVPMYEVIAKAIKEFCPNAWVINYTNPMTICVDTLYRVFPEIKAFGCCHEVFGTQVLLSKMLAVMKGLEKIDRHDIKVNVVGVNHFTWITDAYYKNIDLFPLYKEFADTYYIDGINAKQGEKHINNSFTCLQRVKFDLFRRFGYIAAAGDRHLAEFCPGDWYLKNPQQVTDWKFGLTSVSWRKNDLLERIARSNRLYSGEEKFELHETGEEGINQIRAIMGCGDLVTNVNIINKGQIPNLPIGAIVETNALFTSSTVTPTMAGPVPKEIHSLVSRVCANQQIITEAALSRDLNLAFTAFLNDPLMKLSTGKAKELYIRMLNNTSKYLTEYDLNSIR
ncbi:MAG: alpha-glucosidase/alpha-galactosidase [Clostridia bacterium]|nr:alpha-glucosidase/alpha-galactosidase [Clostridia bacterium]